MTFLEAAIELLRQAGRPLSIKDLTQRAIEQRLLTNEGRTPELTMQARLAQELRKGQNTLLVQNDKDSFGLRRYDKPRLAAGEVAPEPVEPAPPPADVDVAPAAFVEGEDAPAGEGDGVEPGEELAADGTKRKRRRRGGRGRNKKKTDGEVAAEAPAPELAAAPLLAAESARHEPEEGTPEEAIMAERMAEESERADAVAAAEAARHVVEAARRVEDARAAARRVEAEQATQMFAPPGDDEPAVDLDGIMAPSRRRRGLIDLPDEAVLAAEYGDELAETGTTATAPVEGELVDERTADEDRPMLDEIQADDRGGRGRRRRGQKGGKERGGKERGGRGARAGQPAERAPERAPGRDRVAPPAREAQRGQPRPPAASAGEAEAQGAPHPAGATASDDGASAGPGPTPGGPRASLADVGYQLLRSIGDGRPVHARQLAAMAIKRRFVAGEAEDLWRAIRVALLDDARARQTRGLRPRVRHHGSGNFALASARLEPELAALEDQLAQRADALARETRLALRRRLAKLPLPALENLARVLLERLGYTDIERVKRVEATGYLQARVKLGALPTRVLIGVRSGGDEAGRRAVGELRAGVAAKGLEAGLLLSTARVGPEAEREARTPGAQCTVYDGDAFADALIAAGVGVLRVALPVAYLDAEFFAELIDGA